MAEYIERGAALHEIERREALMVGDKCVSVDAMKFFIKNRPAADVAPVVHGRWISKNPHGYEWTFVCSNCDYVDGYPFNDRHNYCPNCGAKMDGGDGDTAD